MKNNHSSKFFKTISMMGLVLILTMALSMMASAASNVKIKKVSGKKGLYYCVNNKIKTSKTGIVKVGSKKYLVKKGKVRTNCTGLVKVGSRKYLVKKGVVRTNYTGIYKDRKTGKKYVIKKGKLNKVSGTYTWKGTTYKVKKGVVKGTVKKSSSAVTPSTSATNKNSAAQMTASVYSTTTNGYYYSQLNSTLQAVYNDFYSDLMNGQQPSTTMSVSSSDVNKAYKCLKLDHPEIFWTRSNMSSSDRSSMKSKIESAASSILSGVSAGASDYQKIKYVYDYIINSTTYSYSASDNQDIQSVLLNHSSVCAGYARTFQYLVNRMGIFCITVEGDINGESHAWNVVRLDGSYYYVDATFGDRYARNGQIDYSYLCYNKTDLSNINGRVIMDVSTPKCSGTKYDYYKLNGTYYKKFNQKSVASALTKAAKAGRKICSVKFASASAYRTAISKISDTNGALNKALNSSHYTSYHYDNDMHTISFMR